MHNAHKRRTLSFFANISPNNDTKYTLSKRRFLANSHNKTKLISLFTEILSSRLVCVVTSADNADTWVFCEASNPDNVDG